MRLPNAELLVLLVLAASGSAAARESDRQQEMKVAAEDTDTQMTDDGETRLIGNVTISQGTLRIEADAATVSRKAGEVVRVVFEGKPARLQQESEQGELMRAQGNRIDYDVGAESVVLSGNVVVDQAGDDLRGERITYDLKSERLKGSGEGGGDGRIHMTIQPRAAKPKPDTAQPDPAKPDEAKGDQP
jgi:lipopolysaccharide export system protein LptA